MSSVAGSWVVTRRATGEVIGEFFDRRSLAKFNPETTKTETAAEYLGRLNRQLENHPRDRQALDALAADLGMTEGV